MDTKSVVIGLLVAVFVGAAAFWYSSSRNVAQVPENPPADRASTEQPPSSVPPQEGTGTAPAVPAASSTPAQAQPPAQASQGTFSSGEEVDAPDILVVEVSYDGKAYSPSSVSIKTGDVVIFKNNSAVDFWPASAPHPAHTDYPEFDAKKAIAPGGKFQFSFTKVGTWKFHDHLNPSAYGSVTVAAR